MAVSKKPRKKNKNKGIKKKMSSRREALELIKPVEKLTNELTNGTNYYRQEVKWDENIPIENKIKADELVECVAEMATTLNVLSVEARASIDRIRTQRKNKKIGKEEANFAYVSSVMPIMTASMELPVVAERMLSQALELAEGRSIPEDELININEVKTMLATSSETAEEIIAKMEEE